MAENVVYVTKDTNLHIQEYESTWNRINPEEISIRTHRTWTLDN